MPRTARAAMGGVIYHVLNRGNDRARIFHKPADFEAFIKILIQGLKHASIEILAFCLMGNHWHLVLRPRGDKDLARYLAWISNTHVKRYRAHRPSGSGHLYQGRYKSFPVEDDEHLLIVIRYVEANPLRARLVPRAQAWRWSSLGCPREIRSLLLSDWPVERPADWTAIVNRAMPQEQVEELHTAIERGRPFGSPQWMKRMIQLMGLSFTMRPRGRPRKSKSSPPTGRRGGGKR